MLPVEHLSESIAFILHSTLSDVLMQIEINSPPLNNLRIRLLCNQPENFFSKLRNSKVSISANDFGKSSLVVWSFMVDRVKSMIKQFIQK